MKGFTKTLKCILLIFINLNLMNINIHAQQESCNCKCDEDQIKVLRLLYLGEYEKIDYNKEELNKFNKFPLIKFLILADKWAHKDNTYLTQAEDKLNEYLKKGDTTKTETEFYILFRYKIILFTGNRTLGIGKDYKSPCFDKIIERIKNNSPIIQIKKYLHQIDSLKDKINDIKKDTIGLNDLRIGSKKCNKDLIATEKERDSLKIVLEKKIGEAKSIIENCQKNPNSPDCSRLSESFKIFYNNEIKNRDSIIKNRVEEIKFLNWYKEQYRIYYDKYQDLDKILKEKQKTLDSLNSALKNDPGKLSIWYLMNIKDSVNIINNKLDKIRFVFPDTGIVTESKTLVKEETITVFFNTSKFIINNIQNVDELAEKLNLKKDWTVKIIAYADTSGRSEYNLLLSEMRAKAVKARLMEKGVEFERIETVGLGNLVDGKKEKRADIFIYK